MKIFDWFIRTRFYVWFMSAIMPKIRFSWSHTRIKGKQYHEGYAKLKPGHIILSSDEKRLTSLLTPGKVDHAAICVDVGSNFEIAEMTQDGLIQSTFYDTCHTADRVVILDCSEWDDNYKQEVIEYCKSLQGVKYDFQFELGDNELYCSELIYHIDLEGRLRFKKLHTTAGDYVTPQCLLDAENVVVVWDSDGE